MQALDDLKAQVASNRTVVDSALSLIQAIASRITAAGTDPVALAKLTNDLKLQDDDLANAVTLNTPGVYPPGGEPPAVNPGPYPGQTGLSVDPRVVTPPRLLLPTGPVAVPVDTTGLVPSGTTGYVAVPGSPLVTPPGTTGPTLPAAPGPTAYVGPTAYAGDTGPTWPGDTGPTWPVGPTLPPLFPTIG